MQENQIFDNDKKICLKCDNEKTYEEFHKDSKNKDGLKKYCKLCSKSSNKYYYQKDKDKRLIEMKKRSEKLKSDKLVIYYKNVNDLVTQFVEKIKEINDNNKLSNEIMNSILSVKN